MRIAPTIVTWAGVDPTDDLINGVTPAPRLEYLIALAARVQAACTAPYAQTGFSARLRVGNSDAAGNDWAVYQMVNVGTYALRAKVARSDQDGASSPRDTHIVGASSGSGADDEIVIPCPFSLGEDDWPPDTGQVAVVSGSDTYTGSPAEAQDRMLESPTAASLAGPVAELIKIRGGVGFTVVPIQVADLGAL